MGLHSQIGLDQDFSVGHMFGASGTRQVLLDAEGIVASAVVAGAANVLALVRTSAVRSA
jgi:N-acetylglucosamine kinase-like BadF-type ATPase